MPAVPVEYTQKIPVSMSNVKDTDGFNRNEWRKAIEDEIVTHPARPHYAKAQNLMAEDTDGIMKWIPGALETLNDTTITYVVSWCRNYADLSNNLKY